MTSTLGMIQKKGTSYTYKSNVKNLVGTDTIYYNMTKEGCKMQVMRQIRVTKLFYASIKVLLGGPYLGAATGADSMRCSYVEYGYMPKGNTQQYISPYDSVPLTKDIDKINVGGTIADWVQIIVQEEASGNYVDTVSAFLRQDGIVCDTSGAPYLSFKNLKLKSTGTESQAYNLIIRHRNHLAIKSKGICLKTLSTDVTATPLFDLTKLENVFDVNPTDPMKALVLESGKYCMIPYDFNGDGSISLRDKMMAIETYGFIGYKVCDSNFTADVSITDIRYFATYSGYVCVFEE